MNRILLTLSAGLLLLAGCEPLPGESPSGTKPVNPAPAKSTDKSPPAGSAEKLKQKSGEAWEAAGEFAAESKDEFVAEARRRLALMDKQLEDWKKQSASMSEDAKAKWEVEKVEVQKRRDELQKELDKLSAASADAWADLKVGAGKAWKETADAFRKAGEHFKE